MFPPIPPWEGMHVLVVHMPIGLLLAASVFVLLATVFPRWAGASALILLSLGTVGAWVAVATGEAARDVVEDGPDPIWDLMERHEELADMTLNAFAALTVLYAVIVLLPLFWKKAARPTVAVIANLAFLVLLLGGNLLIANTAHLGGLLVHLYGVRAQLGLGDPLAEMEEEVDEEPAEEEMSEEEAEEPAAEEMSEEAAEKPAAATAEEPAPEPAAPEPSDPPAAASEEAATP